jgi:hypothetical protein
MADDIDNLFAIAEIAGVFIGFAALASVLAGKKEAEPRFDDTVKLAGVVIINVMIIAAALFPVVVNRYGLAHSSVWRISSGFLEAVNLLQLVFLSRTMPGYVAAIFQRRILSVAVWSLSPFFHIPLLLCIFGIMPTLAPAFFFTAIVAAIFQSSLLFADLVISMIAPVRR